MLIPLNETKHRESSQGSIRRQSSLSCSNPQAHCAGTKPVLSEDAAAAARRHGLKRCHQTRDRYVSASSNGQGPRAPCANNVADKVAMPAGR
jgi:hypothetical protein